MQKVVVRYLYLAKQLPSGIKNAYDETRVCVTLNGCRMQKEAVQQFYQAKYIHVGFQNVLSETIDSLTLNGIRMREVTMLYFHQAKQIPIGFRNVFDETKDSVAFRRKRYAGASLSRRQEMVLKNNSEALGKLLVFAISQIVPVVSWVPVIVALSYPRYLLTSHFWSDEQKKKFRQSEYAERRQYALQLRNLIGLGQLPLSDHMTLFQTGGQLSSLSHLSSDHIKLLAGANATHESFVVHRFMPTYLTRLAMEDDAAFIQKDDILLRKEGVDDMSLEELEDALVKRGLNPILSDDATNVLNMKQCLTNWLNKSSTGGTSYILHSAAMNGIH
jgi:hypothetical protein